MTDVALSSVFAGLWRRISCAWAAVSLCAPSRLGVARPPRRRMEPSRTSRSAVPRAISSAKGCVGWIFGGRICSSLSGRVSGAMGGKGKGKGSVRKARQDLSRLPRRKLSCQASLRL